MNFPYDIKSLLPYINGVAYKIVGILRRKTIMDALKPHCSIRKNEVSEGNH